MSLLVQDGGRPGKIGWLETAIDANWAAGVIITPFETPPNPAPRKPAAATVIEACRARGAEARFDPMTHAALMPSTNNWTVYDQWNLWRGARGDLSTDVLQRHHVERLGQIRDAYGVTVVCPTRVLHDAVGWETIQSLRLAELATALPHPLALAVVGSNAFWSQGRLLDDYVGQIAQMRPREVHLAVWRPAISYPPPTITSAEIQGVCRTVHSLSLRAPVIVQYADLFGLPAIAAGATQVGTGWDLRQRVLGPEAFRLNTEIRRASSRITHRGLLGVLKRPEAERLARVDIARSMRLVPGGLPLDGNDLWEHHLAQLSGVEAGLAGTGDRQTRSADLLELYRLAWAEFARVAALAAPLETGPDAWLRESRDGLAAYRAAEGW